VVYKIPQRPSCEIQTLKLNFTIPLSYFKAKGFENHKRISTYDMTMQNSTEERKKQNKHGKIAFFETAIAADKQLGTSA